MQNQQLNWKLQCLALWDQECNRANSELLGIKIKNELDETFDVSFESQNEVIHNVKPGETLQGISLQYGVDTESIKWKNGLYSDEIYYITELIIPSPKLKGNSLREPSKEEKRRELMRVLKLQSKDENLAVRLLQESSWNVEETIRKYRADLEWERAYMPLRQNVKI